MKKRLSCAQTLVLASLHSGSWEGGIGDYAPSTHQLRTLDSLVRLGLVYLFDGYYHITPSGSDAARSGAITVEIAS